MTRRRRKNKRWTALLKRIPKDAEWSGVEVGVFAGATLFQLLKNRPHLEMFGVDPWVPGSGSNMRDAGNWTRARWDQLYSSVQANSRLYPRRCSLLRMTSERASVALMGWFDFVFIDGLHDYQSVLRDIELWWPHVRRGGFLSGHDYSGGPGKHPGVKQAVDEWLSRGDNQNLKLELDFDHTWFIRKP